MELLAAAARTASDAGNTVSVPVVALGAAVLLDVSAAATTGTDALNVRVQHSLDGGASWDDFISYAQVLGNDVMPKRFAAQWSALAAPDAEHHALLDGSLAAGSVVQGPVGGLWRVKWTIAGTSPSFTFRVLAAFTRG